MQKETKILNTIFTILIALFTITSITCFTLYSQRKGKSKKINDAIDSWKIKKQDEFRQDQIILGRPKRIVFLTIATGFISTAHMLLAVLGVYTLHIYTISLYIITIIGLVLLWNLKKARYWLTLLAIIQNIIVALINFNFNFDNAIPFAELFVWTFPLTQIINLKKYYEKEKTKKE